MTPFYKKIASSRAVQLSTKQEADALTLRQMASKTDAFPEDYAIHPLLVNAKDPKSGRSALHRAIETLCTTSTDVHQRTIQQNIVRLLYAGADLTSQDKQKKSPITCLMENLQKQGQLLSIFIEIILDERLDLNPQIQALRKLISLSPEEALTHSRVSPALTHAHLRLAGHLFQNYLTSLALPSEQRASTIAGCGLFATENIQSAQLVGTFSGAIVREDGVQNKTYAIDYSSQGVGVELELGVKSGRDDVPHNAFFSNLGFPNTQNLTIGPILVLFSLRPITTGTELTWYYGEQHHLCTNKSSELQLGQTREGILPTLRDFFARGIPDLRINLEARLKSYGNTDRVGGLGPLEFIEVISETNRNGWLTTLAAHQHPIINFLRTCLSTGKFAQKEIKAFMNNFLDPKKPGSPIIDTFLEQATVDFIALSQAPQ